MPLVVAGAGVFGLAIGSFLNVVAHRVPRGRSIVAPRSACPACGHGIRARDNVPVLSWLLLRGRCRDCGAAISPRYPLVEAVTAALFVAVALVFGPPALRAPTAQAAWGAALVLVAYLALAGFGVALAAIDLDTRRLPDALVLPLAASGALLFTACAVLTDDGAGLLRAGVGGAALFAFYYAVHLVRPDGMGGGDVKLAFGLGLFLGWAGWGPLAVGALAAFALGALAGGVLIAARRIGTKGGIPFGPWMILGAWVGIFAGDPVAGWYLSLFGLD